MLPLHTLQLVVTEISFHVHVPPLESHVCYLRLLFLFSRAARLLQIQTFVWNPPSSRSFRFQSIRYSHTPDPAEKGKTDFPGRKLETKAGDA